MPTVVLAPFGCHSLRDWPASRWRELADRLIASGVAVQAIGSDSQKDRVAELFRDTPVIQHCGASPAEVIALIRSSACVVANDSGIAHLGGLLGVSTVAIHAGSLPHAFLFDMAPSVTSVVSERSLPRVDYNAEALAGITVNAVLDEVLRRAAVTPAESSPAPTAPLGTLPPT